jgi:uncharacterized protein YqiB (DUF1249 family)
VIFVTGQPNVSVTPEPKVDVRLHLDAVI